MGAAGELAVIPYKDPKRAFHSRIISTGRTSDSLPPVLKLTAHS